MKFKGKSLSYPLAILALLGMSFLPFMALANSGAPDDRFAPPEQQPSGPVPDPNLLHGAGAPTTNSVTIEKIIITQSIQNRDQSVNILKNRETFVRVFFNSVAARGYGQVSGKISVVKAGGVPVLVDNIQSISLFDQWNGQLEFKRNWTSTSLNFKLPASVLDTGTYTVTVTKVEDRYNNKAEVPCANCPTETRQYAVVDTAPLRLTVIGLTYPSGGTTYKPRQIDYDLISSWLVRAYPISQIIYATRDVASTNPWPFTCGQANAQVAQIRAQDVNGGVDARTHYYGLVDDGGGFMRGCAAVPSTPNPAAIGSGPTGSGTWGWDFDGSYGDWYTGHELGHTLGRSHIGGTCGETGTDPNYPFPNGQLSGPMDGYVGFDAGVPGNDKIPRRALPGAPYVDTNTWHDVMSYCKYQWVSSYTYDAIRTRLIAENALPPSGPTKPLASGQAKPTAIAATPDAHVVKTGDFLHIVATVNLTKNTGDIHSVHRVKRAAVGIVGSQGGAIIRLLDRTGKILSEHPHTILESSDLPQGADRTGLIDATVPYSASVGRVEISISGKVIDSREASSNPPRITPLGTSKRANANILQWRVEDADAEITTSLVQVSDDDGKTWRTLAIGLKESRFELSPELAGTIGLKYRVTVSDGFHSVTGLVSPN